ncbi:MAG: Polynucleotide adenylyltransferase/metal dependent phosphohydrolase [Parcubacteria group bacterium GW2011_GWA2_42_14]|nr:MAG: Polynucleotide adenylyltransferase/metal dependent phosphohydrolase [Parcubacteria group bacterium GW2011_GWA2_42_14]
MTKTVFYVKNKAMKEIKIPKEISEVAEKLQAQGFQAYVVGGCARDLLLGIKPADWDITTDAKPEEIQKIFPDSFYANQFLTVTVRTDAEDETVKEVEITTFRAEGRYTDKRHPDEVRFAETLEEDLSRRDFTINAIALEATSDKRQATSNMSHVPCLMSLIDPFDGQADLEKKLIRAVGEAEKRFEEDALRMLRAARFASHFGFFIEEKTLEAIKNNAGWLQAISKERIRDEFIKIVASKNAKEGMELLRETGILKHIVPELLEGYGVGQNKHHIYTVWEHNLRALEYGASQNYPVDVRIAALFHDIGKPRAKRGEGPDSTFYGHDVVGGKMSFEILTRLRFPAKTAEKIAKLVRWHLFNYKLRRDAEEEIRKELGEKPNPLDPEEIELKGQNYTTDASIRRLIRNIGPENMDDLVKVRICDRIGSGVPKAVPYRLRHFQYRVEKILREGEAVKVTMLKINGDDLKKLLNLSQGPKIGHILNALFEEALDDAAKNNREYLELRAVKLNKLSEEELVEFRKKAQNKVELIEEKRDAEIKKRYWVK